MKFLCVCDGGDVNYYNTEAEALQCAEDYIEECRKEAGYAGEWERDMEVIVAQVTHAAREFTFKSEDEENPDETYTDYKMEAVH